MEQAKPSRIATIKHHAVREFRTFLIFFFYLWALFGLFVLNEAVITRMHGGTIAFQGFAVINAFVLAKVMMVIEKLELARWLRDRPRIVVILYEAAVCAVLFIVFHIAEHMIVDYFHGEAAAGALAPAGGYLGLLIVAVILFVCLLPFFGFKNLALVIGMDRMREILFQRPTPPAP